MAADLQTLAERSDFRETGRTDEVERLCAAFASRWPDVVRSIEFGQSAEGRPMRALFISKSGRKAPLLMIQAGIHPGESDGKDAGFIALREILENRTAQGVLDRVALLFVPAFNVDGHERVGRWNRPNQNGPEETGWRTTAHNLNLNRDYTKADAPEMQALLRLINDCAPLIYADLHVTDGADFEPDISIQVEPINQGDEKLRACGVQLRDELIDKLRAQGSLPLPFYPDLAKTDDPASGFLLTVYSPRFSTGYFPQRNRFTVLVETHSWKPYATRVRVMRNTIRGLAELTAQHGERWLEATREADERSKQMGGSDVTLDYTSGWREPTKAGRAADEPSVSDAIDTTNAGGTTRSTNGRNALNASSSAGARIIEFRGYAYTRTPSPISGDLVTVYDPTTPQLWRVPYRDRVQPSLIVKAPLGGYVIPPAYAQEIGAKLALHGIEFSRLGTAPTDPYIKSVPVESFRAARTQFTAAPFEGRMRATFQGEWRTEQRDLYSGSLFVPIAQPNSRLVMALLEPQAPDSFAAWGFFNACFEQKEHIEPYVAEQIANEMLKTNSALRAEFERKLKEDSAFAADPSARLDFFLRRHASWDEQFNLYPVFRIDKMPAN